MLTSWKTIDPNRRQSVMYLIFNFVNDIYYTRNVEAAIHSVCTTENEYVDKCQQIILNLKNNPILKDKYGIDILTKSDSELAENTIVADIERESKDRKVRFEQMLHEKYEMMNDKSYKATLKCRRCGSSEVSWEQKQTRSADEASTVFCTCTKCKNRWTMR